jgi:hypothetical protein
MDAASLPARQKQRASKRAKEEAIVSDIKILMLMPKRQTFEYALTCSDDNSQDFHSWLNKGDNNTDFLIKQGLVKPTKRICADHFITFHTTKGKQKRQHAIMRR